MKNVMNVLLKVFGIRGEVLYLDIIFVFLQCIGCTSGHEV